MDAPWWCCRKLRVVPAVQRSNLAKRPLGPPYDGEVIHDQGWASLLPPFILTVSLHTTGNVHVSLDTCIGRYRTLVIRRMRMRARVYGALTASRTRSERANSSIHKFGIHQLHLLRRNVAPKLYIPVRMIYAWYGFNEVRFKVPFNQASVPARKLNQTAQYW